MAYSLSFGPFRLLPEQRQLLEGSKAIRLSSRALDVLIALAQRPGELVTKEELLSLVWPDTCVEEANLRVHIGALRRVLGDGRVGSRYISNIPGRGYSFVAPVERIDARALSGEPRRNHSRETSLPSPMTHVLGRDVSITTLSEQLSERRFVSIVGPGGIGKTTLALALAEQQTQHYEHGAHFVDFAKLSDGKRLAHALAEALGVQEYAEDPSQGVLAYLADKHALILLDNCDHVIDEAAGFAEALVRAAPHSHVLATSREPLRAAGESVHRLGPLPCPPPGEPLTAVQALAYPAAQLFVERSISSSDSFHLSDADAPIVAEICQRLDGIPLAIEFAAATVPLFGLRGLADRLGDRLSLLTRGRRTALPRHQTLRAMLDWSYELLPELEKKILNRLAVYVGTFTLECGSLVASCDEISVADAVEGLSNLVAKSLVTADVAGERVRYRLLESTREYALEKLHEQDEDQRFFRRHAEHYVRSFRQYEDSWYSVCGPGALSGHSTIDNLRSALSWAFSDRGDATIGIDLAAAAAPLWMCLSLMAECRRWTRRTLTACQVENIRHRMQLETALGCALLYTRGVAAETRSAVESALTDAEALEDVDYQLRALWQLSVMHLNSARVREALHVAERLYEVAKSSQDVYDLPIGDRLIGFALHHLGETDQARRRLERMLSRYPAPSPPAHIIRFHFDLRLTAQAVLGEILWLQGYADRAFVLVTTSIKEAIALDHGLTLCATLAKASQVLLLAGDVAAAENYGSMLLAQATRSSLSSWEAEARCVLAVLRIRKGDVRQGIIALRTALEDLASLNFSQHCSAYLAELAEAHARMGEIDDGMAAIDAALTRAEQLDERWCYPELLRVKGDLVLRCDRANTTDEAAGYFKRAIQAAAEQRALSWELRAAMSLVQLDPECSENLDAYGILRSVYARFEEGFSTLDLMRARSLLENDAVHLSKSLP